MNIITSWRGALRGRVYRDQLVASVIILAITLTLTGSFLNYIGARMGAVLQDPLLSLFPPVNFKWITFSLMYSGIAFGFVSLLLYPYSLVLTLRALIVLVILRVICLYLVPLDPPVDALPLADPFIRLPGIRPVIERDLFFAWQTAILALFAFTARWKDMKIIFSLVAVAISILILLQHAHYTIDILAAPCFAYVAYSLAKWQTVQEVFEKNTRPPG